MYGLRNILDKQPVQITGAVMSVLNLAVVAGWVHAASTTVAAGNTALVLILGLFVNSRTTNTAVLHEIANGGKK